MSAEQTRRILKARLRVKDTVVPKKKKSSFSRSKKSPQGVNNLTFGSSSKKRTSARKQEESAASFARSQKRGQAQRSMVDQVMPETRTRETKSDYDRRVSRASLAKAQQQKSLIKGKAMLAIIVVGIVLVAVAVGVFAYKTAVADKLSIKDPETKAAFESSKIDGVSYTLLSAEYNQPGKEYRGPSLLMLMRMDENEKKISLVSIPSSLQVKLSNGEYGRIAETQLQGGDAALIKAVSNFSDVPISHLIKTDQEGFVSLIDSVGGIDVDVSEEVDDPEAGPLYIPQGQQTLDGEAALVFCRATNLVGEKEARSENQQKVVFALAKKVMEEQAFGLTFALDQIAEGIQTNYSAGDLRRLAEVFSGIEQSNVYQGSVPGYYTPHSLTGETVFVSDDSEWKEMQVLLDKGADFTEEFESVVQVDPASFTITVRNGSGVAGAAAQLAESLETQGFKVEDVGNADQHVYDETLIIYNSSEFVPAAESVKKTLGAGRVTSGKGFYLFDTNVLVVIGKDWKPLS